MLYDGVKKEPYHCFQIFFLNKGFKLQKILLWHATYHCVSAGRDDGKKRVLQYSKPMWLNQWYLHEWRKGYLFKSNIHYKKNKTIIIINTNSH